MIHQRAAALLLQLSHQAAANARAPTLVMAVAAQARVALTPPCRVMQGTSPAATDATSAPQHLKVAALHSL